MYKIAVIGDRTSIQGFKAVGFDLYETESAIETEKYIEKLSGLDYAIIYVTEQAAKDCMQAIEALSDNLTPSIILIPGREGSLGIGSAGVKKSVERAVGADIFK